jgi:hypothetical protein
MHALASSSLAFLRTAAPVGSKTLLFPFSIKIYHLYNAFFLVGPTHLFSGLAVSCLL